MARDRASAFGVRTRFEHVRKIDPGAEPEPELRTPRTVRAFGVRTGFTNRTVTTLVPSTAVDGVGRPRIRSERSTRSARFV
jgi:hypothetical protein